MKRFFLTFLTLCLMSTASWSSLEESEPLEKVYKEATVTLSDGSFIDRFHYGEVESTQKAAKDHLNSKKWSVVTADSQSKGYGLWGRSWESPVGNCFSTFCIPLGIEHAEHISWIPLLAGLAVADTLLDLGVSDDEIGLRWINNVLVSGKKVAGIIVEMDLEESMMMLRVGIGLNIDMTHDVLSTIDQPATSLRQLLDTPLTVDDVLSVLASKLKNRFSALEKSISPINEYDSKLLYKGETIVVREGELVRDENKKVMRNIKGDLMYGFTETQGTFVAITNEGFLKLRPLIGDDRIIASGEIVPKATHDL